MRPNIDLPDGLHGQIKEYRKQHHSITTLDEAYEQLLSVGLEQSDTYTPATSRQLSPDDGFCVAIPKPTSRLNSSVIPWFLHLPADPVVARTPTRELDDDGLRQLLTQLDTLTGQRRHQVTATCSQVDGEWYLGGVGTIAHELCRVGERWNTHSDWECHRREEVTIHANAQPDGIDLFITGELGPAHQHRTDTDVVFRNVQLTVVTDGYPVTGEQVATAASRLGFETPVSASPVSVETTMEADPMVGTEYIEIDQASITDYVTYSEAGGVSGFSDDEVGDADVVTPEWVSRLVVENPFHRELLEEVFRQDSIAQAALPEVLARDRIGVNLLDHHPKGDESVSGYYISRLRLGDLTEVTGGRSGDLTNVVADARYIDAE